MFALYTYIPPVLQTLTGGSDGFVMLALVLIGLGFTIGNWLSGKVSNWSLKGAAAIFPGALSVCFRMQI